MFMPAAVWTMHQSSSRVLQSAKCALHWLERRLALIPDQRWLHMHLKVLYGHDASDAE